METKLKKLSLDLKVKESVIISGPATIQLQDKSGTRARLLITADAATRIERPQAVSSAEQARLGLAQN